MAEQKGRIVNATDNACQLLMALKRLDGAGVTELAEELDYAPSAVHAQLNTLVSNGLVVRDQGKYRLSYAFLDISHSILSRFGNFDVVRSEVNKLAEKTGEVAQFSAHEDGEVVYLHTAKGDNAVQTGTFIGKREDIHASGPGKAILSALPNEEVLAIINEHGLPKKTEQTITNPEELIECLERVRERGYAIDDEESVRGLRYIAIPVMASSDRTLGALGITGPASRMTSELVESELRESLTRSVNIIEVNYKFSQ